MPDDRIIPPWELGEKFIPEKEQSLSERMTSIAASGGKATARNNALRKQGFQVKSARQVQAEKVKNPGKRGIPQDPKSKTSARTVNKTYENLTPAMRDRAERFALEYVRDFNVLNAWMRIGQSPNSPTSAYEMMRWPYVQQCIARIGEEAEESKLITRQQVILGLKKEANHFGEDGSASARVSAWGKLGRILQMDVIVTKSDVEITHKGGVMVVPAPPQNLDEWEQVTANVQQRLKQDVTK